MRQRLQDSMLRHGARLDSLSETQKRDRIRDNNIEGEVYPSPAGESIIMTTGKSVAPSSDSNKPEVHVVAPAGGKTDSEIVATFAEALKRPGSVVSVAAPTPYGRQVLEVAIPTAVVMGGVVLATAAIIAIDNKWGHGARVDRLIERGAFDNLTGNMDAAALINGGASNSSS
jgi:hypothetical protein